MLFTRAATLAALALLILTTAPVRAQDAESAPESTPADASAPPSADAAPADAAPAPPDTAAALDAEAPAPAGPATEAPATPEASAKQANAEVEVHPLEPVEPEAKASDDAERLDTMQVTANFRVEDVQDIVGSAQVFGGATLDREVAKGMEDYLYQVPSVSLQKSGNGTAQIAMRGVSNVNGNDLGYGDGSPTVGIYLNDVAIQGSGVFPDLDLFDLKRIEVLKGPQGTLFGEGSMGGAIKMLTMPGDPNQWEVRMSGGVANTVSGDPSENARAALNIPLKENEMALRVVGDVRKTGGYVDYTARGVDDANTEHAKTARAVWTYAPTPTLNFEYLFMFDHNHRDQFPTVDEGSEDSLTNARQERQFADTKFTINALTGHWTLPFGTLTSVSAFYKTYRDSQRRTPVLQTLLLTQFAAQGLPPPPDLFSNASTHVQTDLHSFSQELRLVSTSNEHFDWIAGAFYRDRGQTYVEGKREDTVPDDPTGLFDGVLGGFNPVQGRQEQGHGNETFKQEAVYGEATWKILPQTLELTGGIRLFRETIGFFIDTQFYGAEAFLLATDPSNIDPQTGAVKKYFEQTQTAQDILPKASLAWHLDPDAMVYASLSRGFRSGTPNIYAALDAGPPIVKPDFDWNKEIGGKFSWFGGKLVTNLTAYQIDWQDVQGTLVGKAKLGAASVDFAHLGNAGDARINGAELATLWSPLSGLTLTFNAGYNDGKLVKPKAGTQVSKGSPVPNSPKATGTVGAAYLWPLQNGWHSNYSIAYSYIGKQITTFFPDEQANFRSLDVSQLRLAPYRLLKASIGVGEGRWRLDLVGNNLTDARAVTAKSAPLPQYTIITPRTIGLQGSYDF